MGVDGNKNNNVQQTVKKGEPMKNKRLIGLTAAFASCLLGFAPANAAGTDAPITVAVGVDPAFTPFFVADAQGMFAKHGLTVQIQQYANGGEAADALVAQSADVAGVPDFNLLIRAPRADLDAIGVYVEDVGNYVKVVARNEVASPKDVKRIGIVPGTFSQYAAARFMQAYNLDPASTELVNAGPPEMPQLLQSSAMDAFILWEPWPTRAAQQGGKVLMPISEFGLSYVLTVSTRHDWLKEHPDQAKAFMQAMSDATTFVKEHPAEAAAITKKAAQTPEALTELAVKQLQFGTREISDQDRDHFEKMLDFLTEKKILETRPSLDDLIVHGYAPAASGQ
jgi:NitT/TauT family transport system substrate-binding protein